MNAHTPLKILNAILTATYCVMVLVATGITAFDAYEWLYVGRSNLGLPELCKKVGNDFCESGAVTHHSRIDGQNIISVHLTTKDKPKQKSSAARDTYYMNKLGEYASPFQKKWLQHAIFYVNDEKPVSTKQKFSPNRGG